MPRITVVGLNDLKPESPLNPGRYNVVLKKIDYVTKEVKRPHLSLQMTIIDGPEQDDESNPNGRVVFDRLFTEYGGMKDGGKFCKMQLKTMLEAFGVDDQDDFDTDELVGKEAYVKVAHELDQNEEVRAVVKKYYGA